jgi:Tol biopolymer transport system component
MSRRALFQLVNPGSWRGEATSAAATQVGVVDVDSGDVHFVDFQLFGHPEQINWSPGPAFSDGQRFIVLSMEAGLCIDDSTRTSLWVYDLQADTLKPLMEKFRPVPYATAVGILDDERLVTGHNQDGENRHVISRLDGSDPEPLVMREDGYSYCVAFDPVGDRIAYHTASRRGGYRITVQNFDGSDAVEVVGDPAHLYFGPQWSPDGQWLLFTDCLHGEDEEHMRADLCVVRPDGSDFHRLTDDRSHWLSPVFGDPTTKGGGSELSHWWPDGSAVTWVRLKAGSQTPWPMMESVEVDDHWNRDYRPDQARGGTDLCLLDPSTGDTRGVSGGARAITDNAPGVWDFRFTPSPQGDRLLFCRSRTGSCSELWTAQADGSSARMLTDGVEGAGVDHPRWLGDHYP